MTSSLTSAAAAEVWSLEEEVKQGIDRKGSWTTPRPQDYVRTEDLPAAFTWGDKDGVNMLTKSLNQHIPQCEPSLSSSLDAHRLKRREHPPPREPRRGVELCWRCAAPPSVPHSPAPRLPLTLGAMLFADCGSCWAHGAISALGDRIKIARSAKGIDINLAVQHVLNCGTAGSCHGGSAAGVYQWLAEISEKGSGVAYDTCNPYL